eukprot:g5703.t1
MPIVVGTVEAIEVSNVTDKKHMGCYYWTIPNYTSYSSKRVIHSPAFEKGGETWKMWLFPKGSTHATEGDISLFLHYRKEENVFTTTPLEHPSAKFSIRIIDQLQGDGIRHQVDGFHNFGESNGEWGWKDFAQISRLTEEDSGLLLDNRMKVELNLYVRPREGEGAESEIHNGSCNTVELRVLTDKKLRQQEQLEVCSGLTSFDNCKSYCFCIQLPLMQFFEMISQDVRQKKEHLRFWLCEEQASKQIRVLKNLSHKKLGLKKISDVVKLNNDCVARIGRSSASCSIDIFVESPLQWRQDLPKINEEEDWIAFLKHYNPEKGVLSYIGTIPLRRNCTPEELMKEARVLAGLKDDGNSSVYIERPVSSFLVYQIKKSDDLDAVGIRPGSTLIIQPGVDPKDAKQRKIEHPTVASFLAEIIMSEIRGKSQASSSETNEKSNT